MALPKVSIAEVNRLAFPAMLAGIAEPLIGLADNLILGNMPDNSTEALAAVGIATGFFLFMFWTFVQLETALSSIVARHLGSGTEAQLNSLITQGLALAVIIGLVLFGLTNLLLDPIFDLYNAKGLVREYAVDYYVIRSFGFPITLLTFAFWGVFRGLQNTSWAMGISLGAAILNVVLDIILVYGVEGLIPAMGVQGAAIGSLTAQVAMLLVTIAIARRRTSFRPTKLFPLHHEFRGMIVMSFQFVIRTIALNMVLLLASSTATSIGDQYMAAHAIAHQLWIFSAFVLDGYANAGLAIAGKLIGQKRYGALTHLTRRLLIIGVGVSVVLMIGFGLVYEPIGGWFSNDAVVVEHFQAIFWLVIITQPLNSVAFTMDGVLKGLGESYFLMKLMALGFLIYAGLLWILRHFEIGFESIWYAMVGWIVIRSIWPWLFFKRKFKEIES
jgi:putative MATE family efflux protein